MFLKEAMLPGHSKVSLAATMLCRLQLHTMHGSPISKLPGTHNNVSAPNRWQKKWKNTEANNINICHTWCCSVRCFPPWWYSRCRCSSCLPQRWCMCVCVNNTGCPLWCYCRQGNPCASWPRRWCGNTTRCCGSDNLTVWCARWFLRRWRP